MYPKQIINQLPRFHMSPYSMGDAYELLLLILDNISTAEIRVARADEYVPQIATQQRLISYSGSYNEQQFPAAHAKGYYQLLFDTVPPASSEHLALWGDEEVF